MKSIYRFLFLLLLLSLTGNSFSQINIILRKSFIDSLKNQVNISTDYFVVKMHDHPNPPSKDGDIHVAGYSSSVGLPVVSEIMNARDEDEAIDTLRAYEGKHVPVHIEGAWRLWCEHSGTDTEEQGAPIPPIVDTNPDHVFEIHPVTMVKDQNVISSLRDIEGYTYKKAGDAFDRYAKAVCKLEDKGDKIAIQTKGVGYNYVAFYIEILDAVQFVTEDGRFIFCRAKDNEGNIICSKMRMVFPKDSNAEKRVRDLGKGDMMYVLGIPRINLDLISYRIKHSVDKSYMLGWNLPIEMIVVADLEN